MENFVFEYPTKVYFGKGAAKEHLSKALSAYGPNVMLAYGGGSIKQNGVYDEMLEILRSAGKTVAEFHGIMSNPTYAKVQEGAVLAREKGIDFILAVGGGSVIDCCKVISAQAVLEEDIWDMGLINPIMVDQDYTLVAGLHRLEAMKLLGRAEIECTVSDLDGLQVALAEIDENFVRKDLSDDEFRELLLRRKEIYESLHPEAKRGGDRPLHDLHWHDL